jgi:hypothetical protein
MLMTFGTILAVTYFFLFTIWLIATFWFFTQLTPYQQLVTKIELPINAWIAYACSFAFLLARIVS